MAENKMNEVAKLLGVELEERFDIKGRGDNPYAICDTGLFDCTSRYRNDVLVRLLSGELELEKRILNHQEHKYLSSVISPKFIYKRVTGIVRWADYEESYIEIVLDGGDDCILLLNFKNDSMYKGMEVDKLYTKEELRL